MALSAEKMMQENLGGINLGGFAEKGNFNALTRFFNAFTRMCFPCIVI